MGDQQFFWCSIEKGRNLNLKVLIRNNLFYLFKKADYILPGKLKSKTQNSV